MSSRTYETYEMPAKDARNHFRDAMDMVRTGVHVLVTRYRKVEAVMVHPDWYADAKKAMEAREQ